MIHIHLFNTKTINELIIPSNEDTYLNNTEKLLIFIKEGLIVSYNVRVLQARQDAEKITTISNNNSDRYSKNAPFLIYSHAKKLMAFWSSNSHFVHIFLITKDCVNYFWSMVSEKKIFMAPSWFGWMAGA